MKALLILDDNYLPTLLTVLDNAQSSVDIIAYSFAMGTGGNFRAGGPSQVVEKLRELKTRYGAKISIRLYMEGTRETSVRNRITGEILRKAGVKVKYGATHAKGFCVDGRWVLFGSTNLTNQSMVKNNETNLMIEDRKVVAGYRKYFEHLWNGGKHGGVKLPPPLIADGGFAPALLDLIDRAKTRLDFSIYFFHHTEIEKALIRAHARGVKVRGFFHDHRTFAMSYVRRTRGTVGRLAAAGLKDLHYGPPTLFTHSKYIIRDRKELLLGTGNWLHEDIKVHPQLYIQFEDASLARELAKHLGEQIKST